MTGILIYRVVVSTLIGLMVGIFGYLLYTKDFDKEAKFGVYFMAVVYLLAFVGMWI